MEEEWGLGGAVWRKAGLPGNGAERQGWRFLVGGVHLPWWRLCMRTLCGEDSPLGSAADTSVSN